MAMPTLKELARLERIHSLVKLVAQSTQYGDYAKAAELLDFDPGKFSNLCELLEDIQEMDWEELLLNAFAIADIYEPRTR